MVQSAYKTVFKHAQCQPVYQWCVSPHEMAPGLEVVLAAASGYVRILEFMFGHQISHLSLDHIPKRSERFQIFLMDRAAVEIPHDADRKQIIAPQGMLQVHQTQGS